MSRKGKKVLTKIIGQNERTLKLVKIKRRQHKLNDSQKPKFNYLSKVAAIKI